VLTGDASDSVVGVGGSTEAVAEEEGEDREEDEEDEEAVDLDLVAPADFAADCELEDAAALREVVVFDLDTDSVFACFRAEAAGSGLDRLAAGLEESTETVAVKQSQKKGRGSIERRVRR